MERKHKDRSALLWIFFLLSFFEGICKDLWGTVDEGEDKERLGIIIII
jgi:hypothetical protein